MINDPTLFCHCDNCNDPIEITPEFIYHDYSGNNGHYDCSDNSIEKKLEQEGWICQDGKHFCCEDCQEAGF